ncbi:hypothetical protein EFB08_13860 [Rufibacter latericius]|uniref:Uncharacterized protein n=2 Tax=Rufibacter latericius TaxID=2487040 RepID=A0A3M9MK51_9BACT|nr:hypothetical protein EFB08_13860 [Rufibacter latericius]
MAFAAQARQKNKVRVRSNPPAQTYRVEVESSPFDDKHLVHVLPDSGVLVVSTKRLGGTERQEFKLTKYNKELKPVWKTNYGHTSDQTLLLVASERKTLYLLFYALNNQKVLLHQVNNATGMGTVSEHTLPSASLTPQEMKALDGQVFLNGLEKNNHTILHLNPAQKEVKILHASLGLEELGEFRVDTLTHALELVLTESNGARSRVQTKRLNAKGEVIGTYFVQPQMEFRTENTLQGARLAPGDTLRKVLVGTFGHRTFSFSKGLFTSHLGGNTRYFDFSKLRHFFEYLSPRKERRMKAKFARHEAKEKPLLLRHRVLLHPVMPHPMGYAIVGEVYYPEYKNTARNLYNGAYGRESDTLQSGKSPYDAYRFTHAIACVFDWEGNLLWDNSYRLKNETYQEPTSIVKAGVSPEGNITLVYPEEEYIRYKTLKPNVSGANEEKVEVRLQEASEKLYASNEGGILHWYGGNFVAYGFQRIKPKQGQPRTVFYLQNMTFE